MRLAPILLDLFLTLSLLAACSETPPPAPRKPPSWKLQPSFDCRQARTDTEKRICSSSALTEVDRDLAARFQAALQRAPDPEALRQAQQAWLQARDACQDDPCLLRRYIARMEALETESTPQPTPPTTPPRPPTRSPKTAR